MEMKIAERESGNASFDIEKSFMHSFWEEIEKFRIENTTPNEPSNDENTASNTEENPPKETDEEINDQCEDLDEMDALLSMAFNQCTTSERNNVYQSSELLADHASVDSYQIYERFAIRNT